MNDYTAVVIHNVSLITLVGLIIYVTGSLWGLLGLFFLATTSENKG